MNSLFNNTAIKIIIFIAVFFNITPVLAEQIQVCRVDTNKKIVALTFDDGPNKHYTKDILRILRNENVIATFFLVAKEVERNPDIAYLISDEGHEIGNHSYSHPRFAEISLSEIYEEIGRSQMVFYNMFGKCPRYFRPPYGWLKKKYAKKLNDYFDDIVMWDVDAKDYRSYMSSTKIKETIMKYVKPGSIVLFHDTNERTVSSLKGIISVLRKRGYRFMTVSELLEQNGVDLASKDI